MRPISTRKNEAIERDIEGQIILKELLYYLDYIEIERLTGVKVKTLYTLEFSAVGKPTYEKLKKFYDSWEKPEKVKAKKYHKTTLMLEDDIYNKINELLGNVKTGRKKIIYNEWFKNILDDEKNVYKPFEEKIILHFGRKNQLNKLLEELEELKEAIINNDNQNIYEEMADVLLLINQLSGKTVDRIYIRKIKRTLERIKTGYYDKLNDYIY